MSSRLVRLVVVPIILFAAFSGTALALAELHLAKPSATSAGPVRLGDRYRGETLFQARCATCHGAAGKGGGIGPTLAGARISLGAAKVQVDAGGGAMPAGLVKGREERDVLAYLATILARD